MNPDARAPSVAVAAHPLLDVGVVAVELPDVLGALGNLPDLAPWLALAPPSSPPVGRDDALRSAVREVLRAGGFKPSGRGKPASEYLVGAAEQGRLAPINPIVDACNAASLHGGLPISVVDLDALAPPLSIDVGAAGARYAFNAAGQEIELAGLLCLSDAQGPCATPVKDSHRTKTGPTTRRALAIVWGVRGREAQTRAVAAWMLELLASLGAQPLSGR